MSTKGKWFWLSFYSQQQRTKRNGTQPFRSWVSGEPMEDPPQYTICCLVEDVASEAAAWKLVRAWFSVGTIRFCDEKPRGWSPGYRFTGYVPPPEFAPKGPRT